MKQLKHVLILAFLFSAFSCDDDAATEPGIEFKNHSKTPTFMVMQPDFQDVKVYSLLSSEDQLPESPNFVYGSMADGAGLLKNNDGTYTLINNIEADYSISRITFDASFTPLKGEYIVNSDATANTAQCSGSLITPEEHGFGPLYLSGGEWGGTSRNVFAIDPYRNASEASTARVLTALGQWTTENAVALGAAAYPGKTVILIGDDSHGDAGGQLAMYVSETVGDLDNGKLYALKVGDGTVTENEIKVGTSFNVTFEELAERTYSEINDEIIAKNLMGFNRVEDIDYRKGSAANNREVYFNATGRNQYNDIRTKYGKTYKLVLDANDPLKGTITAVLDGDDLDSDARTYHSPDNILVTENYAYIQEDPNGYDDDMNKKHDAYLYQYNLNTGEVKVVLELGNHSLEAINGGYASANDRFGAWELTGMIDISDIVNVDNTFILIVQAHTWTSDAFLNPDGAGDISNSSNRGSYMVILNGLER
ncbi:MAG: phosphatase [Flammeovirgaceae bacterium]